MGSNCKRPRQESPGDVLADNTVLQLTVRASVTSLPLSKRGNIFKHTDKDKGRHRESDRQTQRLKERCGGDEEFFC